MRRARWLVILLVLGEGGFGSSAISAPSIVSAPARTESSEGSPFSKAASRATLDQLAALQTFIRAALSGDEGGCRIEDREILSAMPELVRAEIESKLDGRAKAELFEELFTDGRRIRECVSRCRCDVYLDWLERAEAGGDRAPPAGIAARVAGWKASLRAKGARKPRIQACGHANRGWICGSALWRTLSAEARSAMNSGS